MAEQERLEFEARMIDNVTRQMDVIARRFQSNGRQMQRSMDGVGRSLGKIKTLLGAGLGLVAFKKTIDAAAKFEKQMREVSTLSEDISENIQGFSQGILDLSAKSGQSLDVLTKGLYDSVSAGVAAGKSLEFLESATQLAIGGATDTATAIDGMTTIMNAFSVSVDDTTKITDAFFTAVKFGKTTVGELAAAIGPLAPTARAAGLSFEERLGAVSAVTKAGFPTREAITAVQGALSGMSILSDDAVKKMESLGLSYKVTGEEGATFADVMNNLNEAAGGTLEGMLALIPNIRGAKGVLALAKDDGESFAEVLTLMDKKAGETAKAYAKMTDTFEFKSNVIKQSFTTSFIEMVNQILPTLKDLADSVVENMDTIKYVIALAGAAIKDALNGWIFLFHAVKTAVLGQVYAMVKGLHLILAKFPDIGPVKRWKKQLDDFSVSVKDKAAKSLDELIDVTEDLDGSALVDFFKNTDKYVSKAATSMKDLTNSEKELLGIQEKPKAAIDKPAIDQEKVDAAKRLQEELNLVFLEGKEKELAELQLWYEDQKTVLEEGGQEIMKLRHSMLVKQFKIEETFRKKNDKQRETDLNKEKALLYAKINAYGRMAMLTVGAISDIAEASGASAKTMKKIAMAEAIVQGALAVQRALGSAPPPLNFALAAITGVATAANVAKIASQAFEQGGFPSGKNALIRVNERGQESVLNARATAGLGIGGVNALNSGQEVNRTISNDIVYSPNITIGGMSSSDMIEDILMKDKQAFANAINDVKVRGYLE